MLGNSQKKFIAQTYIRYGSSKKSSSQVNSSQSFLSLHWVERKSKMFWVSSLKIIIWVDSSRRDTSSFHLSRVKLELGLLHRLVLNWVELIHQLDPPLTYIVMFHFSRYFQKGVDWNTNIIRYLLNADEGNIRCDKRSKMIDVRTIFFKTFVFMYAVIYLKSILY